jgi:hypothetical protein
LAAIRTSGILSDVSAEKLLTIAKISYEEFGSDLRAVLKKPLPQARKALKKFPSVGDPGAKGDGVKSRSSSAHLSRPRLGEGGKAGVA